MPETEKKVMEVQVRSSDGRLRFYKSLNYAFRAAKQDPSVWKISFNAEDGTRIRLIRTTYGWAYEPIMQEE